ncbi:ketopantoate reductase PanE/ApbA C terminal-domain-containing protein [Aspergillus carlsbadensis]|nr:ketopantoate reductase PanE/ApbA C terminal-domain-containing protein [Aspergillus carlsbadensis]
MATPRVLIFGTGSLGIVLGAFLHRSGADIVCVCRSNYETANKHGLRTDSTAFRNYTYYPKIVQSLSESRQVPGPPYEYVVVCTKAFLDEEPSPAELIKEIIISDKTSIVLVQNGIGVEDPYQERFPDNLVISCVAYMPSTRVSPTEVVQTETQRILMGAFPSRVLSREEGDKLQYFADMLRAGGAQAEIHSDIQVERWKKLVGNATWNPICSLSRCRDLELLGSCDIAGSFVKAAMREVVAVAQTLGYGAEVNEDVVRSQIQRSVVRAPPGVQPSMMADMLRGSKMEVEAIVGEVVKMARKNGVSVPRLETLYVLGSGLNWRISQSGEDS